MTTRVRFLMAGALALATTPVAQAQGLAQRIADAPANAAVAFSFPARDGVCGGPGFVRYGNTVNVSSGSYSFSGDSESRPCVPGPVRVTVLRAGNQVVGLETGVGADATTREAQDLGAVSGAQAAEYLLGLARTVEGRPGQAALMPAMLAADANVLPTLQALATNRDLSRQIRQSSISWLSREAENLSGAPSAAAIETLNRMARDESDAPAIRESAMSALARGAEGHGVPTLITLASSNDPWVARTATNALAGSGDPRARAHLRTAVRQANSPDGVRVAALKGLGRSYATAQDIAILRDAYPTLATQAERDAVLSAVGSAGGAANVQWLLGIARQGGETSAVSRAIRAASQAGATSADLITLYDVLSDRSPRSTILGLLAERGDRAAIDKLLAVAQGDTDPALRRTAIQRLSGSSDPRVVAALREMVGK